MLNQFWLILLNLVKFLKQERKNMCHLMHWILLKLLQFINTPDTSFCVNKKCHHIQDTIFFCDRKFGIFNFFTTASRTVLGPTQLPIQWVPGDLSLGVKQLGCEADHSPPSSAKVKE
jgi:hypothetical protein